jgi:hypothetical protein
MAVGARTVSTIASGYPQAEGGGEVDEHETVEQGQYLIIFISNIHNWS